MTREEAIKNIKEHCYFAGLIPRAKEALDVAIEILEQEPSDTVSLEAFKQVMWERDIAIAQLKELGYGFGQKIEPCGDAISRQAVLDGLASIAKAKAKSDAQKALMGRVMFFTEQLPPVTPQPKTGHWIWCVGGSHKCTNCEEYTCFSHKELLKYCPNCGCRMVESQESEDKG